MRKNTETKANPSKNGTPKSETNKKLKSELLTILLDFMEEAGAIAISNQNNLKVSVKSDLSIVTNIDLALSNLFRSKIAKYLDSGSYGILDEENLPSSSADLFRKDYEYLWFIDPIDGTSTYYHGFPLWAIAVALFKNRKPHIGAIYMPVMDELVYSDGKQVHLLQNAFKKQETDSIIHRSEQLLDAKSLILQHKFCNFRRDCNIIDLYACYVLSFYTLTGRSIASFFNKPAKLWDIAATLPIAKTLGLCFRNIKNDQDLEELSDSIIDDDWALRDVYLMTNPARYEKIKNKLEL